MNLRIVLHTHTMLILFVKTVPALDGTRLLDLSLPLFPRLFVVEFCVRAIENLLTGDCCTIGKWGIVAPSKVPNTMHSKNYIKCQYSMAVEG